MKFEQEDKWMRNFIKKYYVYILVMVAFYVVTPLLSKDTGSAMFTLLCLIPFIVLILSLIYAKMNGFKWYLSVIIGLLWFPVIWVYLNESAAIYAVLYGAVSFAGQGIGFLINKVVK